MQDGRRAELPRAAREPLHQPALADARGPPHEHRARASVPLDLPERAPEVVALLHPASEGGVAHAEDPRSDAYEAVGRVVAAAQAPACRHEGLRRCHRRGDRRRGRRSCGSSSSSKSPRRRQGAALARLRAHRRERYARVAADARIELEERPRRVGRELVPVRRAALDEAAHPRADALGHLEAGGQRIAVAGHVAPDDRHQARSVVRGFAAEELVGEAAERVEVGRGGEELVPRLELLRRHVERRARRARGGGAARDERDVVRREAEVRDLELEPVRGAREEHVLGLQVPVG